MTINLSLEGKDILNIIKECKKAGVSHADIAGIKLDFEPHQSVSAKAESFTKPYTFKETEVPSNDPVETLDLDSKSEPLADNFDETEWEHITDPAAWQHRMLHPEIKGETTEGEGIE